MNAVTEITSDKAATQSSLRPASYTIDSAHTRAHFKVRHLMVAWVRGELGTVTGDVQFDQVDPSRSRVGATIDATEINTRNPDRDAHLRSSDFLDIRRHPTVSFRSTAIAQREPGRFDVTGALTIRGVTKPVTLDAEVSAEIQDPEGIVRRGLTATTRINRKDFGVNWNAAMDAGGVVVADHVEITIEAELIRQA